MEGDARDLLDSCFMRVKDKISETLAKNMKITVARFVDVLHLRQVP